MIIDLIAHFRRICAWQFALRIGLTHARIPQRLRRALGIQNRRRRPPAPARCRS